eukprot:UN20422
MCDASINLVRRQVPLPSLVSIALCPILHNRPCYVTTLCNY